MLGEAARLVSVPPALERSCACQVPAPPVVLAVPLLYVIVAVAAGARVSPETVIVCPETETVPAVAVTWPLPAPVCGAVQPAGTAIVTAPLEMPPVAAV